MSAPAHSRRGGWLAALLALPLAIGAAAAGRADEGAAELPAGGLAVPANVGLTVKSQDIRLSVDAVEVAYEIANETGTDLTALVAFPLPALTAGADIAGSLPREDDALNFVGLAVTVDGQPVRPTFEQRASVVGVDITARLTEDGVPLNPYTRQAGREALARLPAGKREFYLRNGLAVWSDGEPLSVQWDVATTAYWHQSFPAGRTLKLRQRYVPMSGSALLAEPELDALGRSRCLDEPARATLHQSFAARHKASPLDNPTLLQSTLTYVFGNGGTLAGPVGDFRITVEKPGPNAVSGTCFEGRFVRETPTKLVFAAKNYLPSGVLSLVFVDAPAAPK